MAGSLGRDELRKALEALLLEMQKKGMLLNVTNAKSLIENIIDKVGKQVTAEKLQTPEMKKSLMVCLMSEVVGSKKPGAMLDYTKLFDNSTPMPQLQDDLKKDLSKLYKSLYELTPGSKVDEKKFELAMDKIAEELMSKYKKQGQEETSLSENENTMNYVLDAFTEAMNLVDKLTLDKDADKAQEESMRSLFGDIKAGRIQVPVRAIIGNLTGIADVSGESNETSGAFMDESNSYQGKADPLGIENTVRERMDSICDTIDEALKAEGVYSTAPKNTRGQ